MNLKKCIKLVALALLLIAIEGLALAALYHRAALVRQTKPVEEYPFNTPYWVKIVDDHEVRLMSNTDSITLYLENSGIMHAEDLVFVKK